VDKDQERKCIECVLGGDQGRYAELVDAYMRPLFRLACSMTGDRVAAEDLVQEAFFRAYTNLDHYDIERSFYSWLYAIALNAIRDWLRKRETSVYAAGRAASDCEPAELASSEPGPEEQIAARQREEATRRALSLLSVEAREILAMRFTAGLAFAEIGEIMGISADAAKTRTYRALEKLRALLPADLSAP